MDIEYHFKARDLNLGLDVFMYVYLSYSPSDSVNPIDTRSIAGPSTAIILGEFNAHDVAEQAYDWFIGQYNIRIDQSGFCDFLTMIQAYTNTPFISVKMVIEVQSD